MNYSHLYLGFREVGNLPSIAKQRKLERSLLERELAGRKEVSVVSVGCGFGEGLNELFSSHYFKVTQIRITAIDIAPVGDTILAQPFASMPNIQVVWKQVDLFDLALLEGFGMFEVVQCGFVMHDIECFAKDKAFSLLAQSLRPGGRIIFSEIFAGRQKGNHAEVSRRQMEEVYDGFLAEADEALRHGALTQKQWFSLVGDGQSPGLKATRREAVAGHRDFFESVEQTSARMIDAGFRQVEIVRNPLSGYLAVMMAEAAKCDRPNQEK